MGCDVVIAGGGPVGLAEALLLKSLNRTLNICIIEGRNFITRDYGIAIGSDAFSKINNTLNKVLENSNGQGDLILAQSTKKIFEKWSKFSSIRTSQIQQDLAKKVKKAGITVLQGEKYKLTQESFLQIFRRQVSMEMISPDLLHFKALINQAKIIVDATGAHSVIRKQVMGPDETHLVDQANYGHVLEIKHEIWTKSYERPKIFHTALNSSVMGNIVLQSVGKSKDCKKPVTDLIVIDKKTYEAFLQRDESGAIVKGGSGKGWSLEELEEMAKTNAVVNQYLQKIKTQIQRTKKAYGAQEKEGIEPAKIATLPLNVYRSKEVVKKFEDRFVLLMGDASSGLVLQRGYTKGLKEAADGAEAIIQYLNTFEGNKETSFPSVFADYQKKVQELFTSEKRWIAFKAKLINIVEWPLKKIVCPLMSIMC